MSTIPCTVRALLRSVHFHFAPRLALVLVVFSAAGFVGTVASAAITVIGDVLPTDNPATTETVEVITASTYNPNVDPDEQDRWESNFVVPGYEDIQAGIVVGQKLLMGGRLDIDGNTAVRMQTMVIGDQGLVGGQTRNGTGTVLITGIGALFSNDPTSIPPGLPPTFAVAASVARATDFGFDMYVGRYGTGKLEIRGGGRAEIQDAVVVGDQPFSSGEIIVDGFASLLGSGGFEAGGGPTDLDPHQMIIGRRGFGRMTIRNAGVVVSLAPAAEGATTTATVGAVIGANQAFDNDEPELGGTGEVYVDGLSSKWVIGGALQIGGFHDAVDGAASDFEGDNVEYASDSGTGRLYVQNGGLVQINPALGADEDDDLVLAIGRFGELILNNGFVIIGGGVVDGGREDNIRVLNDGVITGSGRIETGVFVNRFLGEMRINPGQSLVVDATAEFINATLDDPPLANFGNIQVLGSGDIFAELEFERAPNVPLEPIQPFLNLRVERPATAAPGEFYGGLISAQHSRMRFRSGILNSGMMAFTAGENYVTGNVINIPDPNFPLEVGLIVFRGPNTKVVFENDLNCGLGICDVGAGVTIDVLADHSFITAGDLRIALNPTNPTHITTAGDVGIAGKLTVSMSGFPFGTLSVGDSFEIISFTGNIGGVDFTNPLLPIVDLTVPPLFTQIVVPNLASFGLPAGSVLIPEFTPSSVLLTIRSLLGFIGPDFNGDGIVDFADLAIWKLNKGIASGATVLQGDANGDGAVNGADYLIWFAQLGGPPMPGAGSGGSVPEPASFVMLSMAGMLALAFARRRV